ncbi:hypothetical protein B0H17DRAFT_1211620 [Mycena rosella]|uniref:Uncharacterized protein n=1 Tax=Mycena rosella TaxID=1033263 RepID=A0AAD7G3V5_MYCRO|nr:hypothetical protein B0H17DRAFT_1211620 [Mycena rosella]
MGTTSTNGHIHRHGSTHPSIAFLGFWGLYGAFSWLLLPPLVTPVQGAGGSSFAQLIFEFWPPCGALFLALVLLSTCLCTRLARLTHLSTRLAQLTHPTIHPPCSTDLPHHLAQPTSPFIRLA